MYSSYGSKITSSFNTKNPTNENSNGKKRKMKVNEETEDNCVLQYCVCVNLIKSIGQKYNGEHY